MDKKQIILYMLISIILVVVSILFLVLIDKEVQIYHEELPDLNLNLEFENDTQIDYVDKLPPSTIQLLRTQTGQIVDMDINEYLVGVLAAEMPASYEVEALKAQAVVARTYTYEKIMSNSHGECSVCDTYKHCQAYYDTDQILSIWEVQGYSKTERDEWMKKIKDAVYETDGIVATYEGGYIKAYFHSNSGGRTEDVSQIWGGENIPYLVSVDSVGDSNYTQYSSEVSMTIADLQTKLTSSIDRSCFISATDQEAVEILSYTSSGRVNNVEIGGTIYSANELRNSLGLRSTNFTVTQEGGVITFSVKGFGHGVGMSQTGANYYAQNGMNFQDIIKHYYTGVDVVKQKLIEEENIYE